MNWFDQSRIISSTYNDIKTVSTDLFSLQGWVTWCALTRKGRGERGLCSFSGFVVCLFLTQVPFCIAVVGTALLLLRHHFLLSFFLSFFLILLLLFFFFFPSFFSLLLSFFFSYLRLLLLPHRCRCRPRHRRFVVFIFPPVGSFSEILWAHDDFFFLLIDKERDHNIRFYNLNCIKMST